jgi:RHS repeat-associated protein
MFSTTTITDSTGTILQRFRYSAFGQVTYLNPDFTETTTNTTDWQVFLHGEYYDTDTQWCNYGYRYYVANFGVWTNRDPLKIKSAENLYCMSKNDLNNKFEFLGLVPAASPEEAVRIGDLHIVWGVISAWEILGWKFAPRLAKHSLACGGDRTAETDEINALKTHPDFKKIFNMNLVEKYACQEGTGKYSCNETVGYTFGGKAVYSDIGSAYGHVTYYSDITVTGPTNKITVVIKFKFSDPYDFHPEKKGWMDPVSAFNRLQKNGLASIYKNSGEFEKKYTCCKKTKFLGIFGRGCKCTEIQ